MRQIRIALAGAMAMASIGCSGHFSRTMKNSNEAIDTYARMTRSLESKPSASVQKQKGGLRRWQSLFSDLSAENVSGKVEGVYSSDAFFNDTLKTLTGAKAIEAYMIETADVLVYGKVQFEDVATSGNDTYVRWRMSYRSKVLSKKEDIVTIGMTHLRFDESGKVVLHQDFWDSTRGVFQHVPVVGAGIRLVKKRL